MTLQYSVLRCVALRCVALRCVALHGIPLHYIPRSGTTASRATRLCLEGFEGGAAATRGGGDVVRNDATAGAARGGGGERHGRAGAAAATHPAPPPPSQQRRAATRAPPPQQRRRRSAPRAPQPLAWFCCARALPRRGASSRWEQCRSSSSSSNTTARRCRSSGLCRGAANHRDAEMQRCAAVCRGEWSQAAVCRDASSGMSPVAGVASAADVERPFHCPPRSIRAKARNACVLRPPKRGGAGCLSNNAPSH